MDLLQNAYSNASDEEDEPTEEEEEEEPSPKRLNALPSSSAAQYLNLPRNTYVSRYHNSRPALQTEVPVPGRYVSKRERALKDSTSDSVPRVLELSSNPSVPASPVFGSLSDSNLPHEITSLLRYKMNGRSQLAQTFEGMHIPLDGHLKGVNTIKWSPSHSHLLASAGMDHKIYIWNVWNRDHKVARTLNFHKASVKDVKWLPQGSFVLSCGYDCVSRLIDVEKAMEIQKFEEDGVIGVLKISPTDTNTFLSGGSKGSLRLWDIRIGKVVHEYIRRLGQILDVEFTMNGKQFISSSDVSGINVSENSIIVWDVLRQIPLSNQVYVEAYTCPCVRCHPFDPSFVAQSNGNYIAIFSLTPPFKLDKYKRFESHSVSGFPVKCSFSKDGETLVSGSSDGSIYFYNYRTTKLLRKIEAYKHSSIDVDTHPILPGVVASCNWNGDVTVFGLDDFRAPGSSG